MHNLQLCFATYVVSLHIAGDFEIEMKRYLEWDKKTEEFSLRLVSIHRSLKTGEETESISFFQRTGPSSHAFDGEIKSPSPSAASPTLSKSSQGQAKSRVSFSKRNDIIHEVENEDGSDEDD